MNKDIYHLKGYSHKNTIRKQRTGGGVSLFIKDDIHFHVRDNINITLSDVDTLFIEIPKEELHSNKNVIVVVCYRPPHVCIRKFTEEMTVLLEQLHALTLYDPGGGALKAPPPTDFLLSRIILELHYCALVTFPKK